MESQQKPDESQELELLERAFLLFGLAGTDEELEKMIKTFLIPVTHKMSSGYGSVRNKTMELLSHMTKRLQSRPQVQLPVMALLELLQDTNSSQVVQNFVIVYLRLGIPRLTPQYQINEVLPLLVVCLNGKTLQQIDSILQMYTGILVHVTTPISTETLPNLVSIIPSADSKLRRVFLDFQLYLLLTPYNYHGNLAPPALTWSQYKQVIGDKGIEGDTLERMKVSVIHLLTCEHFETSEILVHLVMGTCDPRHSVYEYCDQHLKQLKSFINYEQSNFISRLFEIFLGKSIKTPSGSSTPSAKQMPANLRMKLNILPLFLKSNFAANSFPACIQVLYESLFGTITNSKLKLLALEFLLFITSNAVPSKLQLMAPLLMTALYKVIDDPESRNERKLTLCAYSGIGSVAKKAPHFISKDTKHIYRLFDELEKDDNKEYILAIQECLNTVALAYHGNQDMTEANITLLESLLLKNIYRRQHHSRLAAAYCAHTIFSFSHIPSRYVSLLACGDDKQEVREEGIIGLRPSQEDLHNSEISFPYLSEMVEYIHSRAKAALDDDQCYSVAAGKLPFPPLAMKAILTFLYHCLLASTDCGFTVEKILTLDLTDPLEREIASRVKDYVESLEYCNETAHQQYLNLIKYSLSPAADADLTSVAVLSLQQIILCSSDEVALSFVPEINWIKKFTQSLRTETREAAARLIGHIASYMDRSELATAVIEGSLKDLDHPIYTLPLSGIVVLGHVAAVCVQRVAKEPELVSTIETILQRLLTFFNSTHNILVKAVCCVIGEIARAGPLPIPDQSPADSNLPSKELLFERLKEILDYSTEIIFKEKCALSIGYFSLGDPNFPFKERSLDALVSLREKKHTDLHFSIGEALSCIAAGQYCDLAHNPWNYTSQLEPMDTGQRGEESNDIFEKTLSLVIDQYGYTSSPRVRQASCIWTLCLLQHCQDHPLFQTNLPRFQRVFLNFLSENDDVLQEVASRGLGLLYELSDASHKQELVTVLVGTLMEGKKSSQSVSEDTKVFSHVSLGKTPQGSGLSTYKELCSLASDLNQPDLIYKFMGLANHHAIWNSKKGAAFGVSGIAIQARDQLAPFLPTLVPRLYRYKYDPLTPIQLAMTNIWNAVVPESNKMVELYFKEIILELCTNLSNSQWRNRESSCLALRDLLSTTLNDSVISKYLEQLWELTLRVRDDIKETVRKAAELACKALLNVTIRICDGGTKSALATATIQSVLPIFLNNGTSHPAQEIRAVCLLSLLKVMDKAGPLLKPHISQIIPLLLQSLSSLEPQVLNTISLQIGSDADIQEKLENIRVSASKTSPLIEAVNRCVPHIDKDVLTQLVPHLADIIKSGVGLSTKVSCADFIINLSRHNQSDFSPHAGKILGALLSGLSDRSVTVRKSYAKAIGYVVKIAKEASIRRLVEKLKKMYLEKGDSTQQSSVAYAVHEMALHCTDAIKGSLVDLAPLIFLAMHTVVNSEEPNTEAMAKIWKETWQELIPSTVTGIKLYLKELLDLVCPSLSAQSWSVKKQAANALATIANNIGDELRPPHLTIVLRSLMEGLQGRLWDGKETLLTSLKTVCVSCAQVIKQQESQPNALEIVQCLLSQCKKQTLAYKNIAIAMTGQVIEVLQVNVFREFYEILETAADYQLDTELTKDDGSGSDDKVLFDLKCTVYESLGRAWPTDDKDEIQTQYLDQVCRLISVRLKNNNWKMQCAILKSLTVVLKRSEVKPSSECLALLNNDILLSVCDCIRNVRYMSVRKDSLSSLNQIIIYLKVHDKLDTINEETIALLYEVLVLLKDPQLQDMAHSVMVTIGK